MITTLSNTGIVALALFVTITRSVCSSSYDFETIVGGYEELYEISNLVFDVDNASNDVVVAGNVLLAT